MKEEQQVAQQHKTERQETKKQERTDTNSAYLHGFFRYECVSGVEGVGLDAVKKPIIQIPTVMRWG